MLKPLNSATRYSSARNRVGEIWDTYKCIPRVSRRCRSRQRSSTRRSVRDPELQIIIRLLEARSRAERTASRCSGMPSSTDVSQVPQPPCWHDRGTSMPAASTAWRMVSPGLTLIVRPERDRTTLESTLCNRSFPGAKIFSVNLFRLSAPRRGLACPHHPGWTATVKVCARRLLLHDRRNIEHLRARFMIEGERS